MTRLDKLCQVVLCIAITTDDSGIDRDPVRPDRHLVLIAQGVDGLLRDGLTSGIQPSDGVERLLSLRLLRFGTQTHAAMLRQVRVNRLV
jgi:hypothetical protein